MKRGLSSIVLWVLLGAGVRAGEDVEAFSKVLQQPLLADGQAEREIQDLQLRLIPPPPGEHDRNVLDELARLRKLVLEEVVFRGWPESVVDGKVKVSWLPDGVKEFESGYRMRKLIYEPYPGLRIPALLYEPQGLQGKVPVVIHVNGHERGLGKAAEYKQRRVINIVRRGMIALNPEWIGMGELRKDGFRHTTIGFIDLCGKSGLALFYLALRGAVDTVLSHPHADSERLAVTGLSGGGWQTIVLSALDERVRACAPNAGYIGLRERVINARDIGDLEQNPVDLVRIADYTHLTAMLIPRPALLIYNRFDDCCFAAGRARSSVYAPVQRLYHRFAPQVEFSYHENLDPGTHNYGLNNREAFYGFVNRCFVAPEQRVSREIPCDAELLSFEELKIGEAAEGLTFLDIARDLARDLPLRKAAELARSQEARQAVRDELRQVLRLEETDLDRVEPRKLKTPEVAGATGHRLLFSNGLSVPVVEFVPSQSPARGVAILCADEGRPAVASRARELVDRGYRVLVADLVFLGECQSRKIPNWQLAMIMSALGRRSLGEEVGQLLSVADWAGERYGQPVTLCGNGKVTSLVALLAGGLQSEQGAAEKRGRRVTRVAIEGAFGSLKEAIANEDGYRKMPQVYCFGLLEVADVDGLVALNEARVVKLEPGEPWRE
jgi:dienelactone hydrolase